MVRLAFVFLFLPSQNPWVIIMKSVAKLLVNFLFDLRVCIDMYK